MQIKINIKLAQEPRELKLDPERYGQRIRQFGIEDTGLALDEIPDAFNISRGNLSIRYK